MAPSHATKPDYTNGDLVGHDSPLAAPGSASRLHVWHMARISGYGTHLVYVHSLNKSDPPAFTDIVDLVQQDWEEMKLQELNEKYIEGLMSRYEIVIEQEGNEESDG